jgi:hypothetical protein
MKWKELFRAALVEVDPTKLVALIRETEIAMAERGDSLPADSIQEQQEIQDARYSLRFLKNHELARSAEAHGTSV